MDKSSPILIVGGGTWGSSTALHLARRGYSNITVLDPYNVPSPIAAGNDINKIVEQTSGKFAGGDDEAYVSHKLSAAATQGWLHDDVFMPYYHDTGYVLAASSPEALRYLNERELADDQSNYLPLKSPEEFQKTMPQGVLQGSFPKWEGWFKQSGAGWAHARKALGSAACEAERLGVHFVTGSPKGSVTKLLYKSGDIIGAETADGKEHIAHRTILCAGANAEQLFDFKDQLRPTAWTLAHIKMAKEEVQAYKDLPVLFNIEKGFFMEPDEDRHELKICDEHPGYCNWVTGSDGRRRSIPFAKHQIPKDSETRIRAFLEDCMPQLAKRPFVFARICWCADTPDRMFLIDYHPDHPSLLLACGGSGHGYAYIPAIGGFIADRMEGTLEERLAKAFRWRPETAVNRDWQDTQGRFGGPNEVMDFQKVKEWTRIEPRP